MRQPGSSSCAWRWRGKKSAGSQTSSRGFCVTRPAFRWCPSSFHWRARSSSTRSRCPRFEGTPLDIALRDCGINSFIIAGVATEIGIEPTVRHGADLGHIPIVVTDACGAGHAEAAQRALASIEFLDEVDDVAADAALRIAELARIDGDAQPAAGDRMNGGRGRRRRRTLGERRGPGWPESDRRRIWQVSAIGRLAWDGGAAEATATVTGQRSGSGDPNPESPGRLSAGSCHRVDRNARRMPSPARPRRHRRVETRSSGSRRAAKSDHRKVQAERGAAQG